MGTRGVCYMSCNTQRGSGLLHQIPGIRSGKGS
jgi:hypothetical protein